MYKQQAGGKMDKKKSILNVCVSVGSKILTIIMVIVVKRFLISECGNEVNGLNALYLSIIGFLSVAELGVGSAITFCMYRPIVDKDENKISALYCLFKKLYLIIGGVILICGLAITPFITFFAKDYALLDVNYQLTFVLMLISVVLTYLYGAKTALINAYKNNYITFAISSGGLLLQYVLQIAVLVLTGSFVWYLGCRIVCTLVQWLATDLVADRKYSRIIKNRQKVDTATRAELIRSIKAMFMHKVGLLLVNTVDGTVISMFVGLVALGKYSNYTMILTSASGVLTLVFSSLTSVVGHLCAQKDRSTAIRFCEAFHLLNFVIGAVFYLGYYVVADDLISILFSSELVVDSTVRFVISFNGFVQFLRNSVILFRDATGTFYNDRYKPLAEGVVNIILSVILVQYIGIAGVIIATVITTLLICHVVEPYVLYKNAFHAPVRKYYLQNYSMIALFFVLMAVSDMIRVSIASPWVSLFVNGCISVAVSGGACLVVLVIRRDLSGHLLAAIKKKAGK